MTVFKVSDDADRKQERLRVKHAMTETQARNDEKTRLQNLSVIPHLMRNLKKQKSFDSRNDKALSRL